MIAEFAIGITPRQACFSTGGGGRSEDLTSVAAYQKASSSIGCLATTIPCSVTIAIISFYSTSRKPKVLDEQRNKKDFQELGLRL
jgi:hypothetical protein